MSIAGQFVSTAYGPPWGGIQGGGTTATGVKLPGQPTGKVGPPYIVAVDPSVIPLGTRLTIWPNPAGDPNIVWTAGDTGGAIKGNRIDFLDLAGRSGQDAWGRQPVTISATTAPASTSGPADPGGAAATGAGSSIGSSDWLKLLLDAAFLGAGVFALWAGTRKLGGAGSKGPVS